jgi:hypothetical protein
MHLSIQHELIQTGLLLISGLRYNTPIGYFQILVQQIAVDTLPTFIKMFYGSHSIDGFRLLTND